MSAGGVFTLIANEGRTDRLLLATALLNQRISDIKCARRRAGKSDCWPTLVDIERTHVLFMNAHYKPFVAIGYEYNKVKVQNGVPSFGTEVVFSIPQFGDFFYDIVCRVVFGAWGTAAQSTPGQDPQDLLPPSWTHNNYPPGVAPDANGIANYYRLVRYDGKLLSNGGVGAGNLVPPGYSDINSSSARAFVNLVHWVEFPANRFFKRVWFNVNNNPLDEYNDTANVMYEKFCVPPGKRDGYNRMAGQEVAHDGWSGPKNVEILESDNGATGTYNWLNAPTEATPNPRFATGLGTAILETQQGDGFDENEEAFAAGNSNSLGFLPIGDPVIARYLYRVVDGPQTPKEVQPSLEIMHRLHFWFNEDVRLAVPSVSIPYGQRYIHMQLANVEEMAVQEPGLFVEHVTTSMGLIPLSLGQGTTTYAYGPNSTAAGNNVVSKSESEFFPYLESLTNDQLTITSMELYINNIFVNPEIHDIFIRRIGFSLIRVHRLATISVSEADTGEKLLSQMKWPIEYMFVGMRPKWNTTTRNRWMWRDWHRMTKVDTAFFPDEGVSVDCFSGYEFNNTPNLAAGDLPIDVGTLQNSAIHAFRLSKKTVVQNTYAYERQTIDSMRIQAHGINLYDYFNQSFYNAYLPYQYGGYNITTPHDPGAMIVTFCFFPKTYQPSGHLNVSRAREFYLSWTSTYLSATNTADLLVVASALNFLLISDGSAVLRYST